MKKLLLSLSLVLSSSVVFADNHLDFGNDAPKIFHEYLLSEYKSETIMGNTSYKYHKCDMGFVYKLNNTGSFHKQVLVYNIFTKTPLLCEEYDHYLELLKEQGK